MDEKLGMGRTYLFECPRCGYRAKVAGGADRGFHFAVQTILCLECKELYDAVTELKVPFAPALSRWKLKTSRLDSVKAPVAPPTFQAALNRLAFTGVKRFRWLRFKAVCPISARHRVRDWKQPGKCPKCGILVECNALPFRIWD
ncbi:MAG: hypothetical protein IH623_13485 [Verrucomicrobia bacterium]|nr:hypothetical protein [Verrucomicrobiota bacterium]